MSPIEINPGADGVLAALEQLTGKDLELALPSPQAESEPAAAPTNARTGDQAMTTLNRAVDEKDWVRGSADAPVTLLEYGDFECPFCGQAFWELKRLEEAVGERVRFVFRHFPLAQAHPHARLAAEAAEAAGAQGKFWEMHDTLFTNQSGAGALRPAGVRR